MPSVAAPSLWWFVARGSGMVAYVLLTAAVIVGIALSRRWHSAIWPHLMVERVHRWLTSTLYAFLLIHTVAIWQDPFTHFRLVDVLVPFASTYRPVWLSMGIVAAELGLAIGASALLRRWIGYRVWHVLHLLTYLLFPLSLLHALGTGTDTRMTWATFLYVWSVLLVLGALIWRTLPLRIGRGVVFSAALVAVPALLLWASHGPYAPGWAVAAGTPKTALVTAAAQRGALPAPTAAATASAPSFPATVRDNVTGQAVLDTPGAQMLLRGAGAGSTPLDVAWQVVRTGGGLAGQVQVRTATHQPLCTGPLTAISSTAVTASCTGYGQQLQLHLTLQRLDTQGFVGTLVGNSGSQLTAGTVAPPTTRHGDDGGAGSSLLRVWQQFIHPKRHGDD